MINVSGGCTEFKIQSIGGWWSWKVENNNIQGQGQFYQINYIDTPYGPYANTLIPIPGDVILAMADSLSEIQQQLAPLLSVLSPVSYNITVTEGDVSSVVTSLSFQNTGAFGSYMTVTATPSVNWLRTNPTYATGIGKNEQSSFEVIINPALLTAAQSPVIGVINLQDNRVPPTTIPVNFSITINPRPVLSVSPINLTFSYNLTTHISSGSQQVTIQNAGPINSTLNFALSSVQNTSPWLVIVPVSGGPLLSGQSDIITFGLDVSKLPISPGVYSDIIRVVSYTASNSPIDIAINLQVT